MPQLKPSNGSSRDESYKCIQAEGVAVNDVPVVMALGGVVVVLGGVMVVLGRVVVALGAVVVQEESAHLQGHSDG